MTIDNAYLARFQHTLRSQTHATATALAIIKFQAPKGDRVQGVLASLGQHLGELHRMLSEMVQQSDAAIPDRT